MWHATWTYSDELRMLKNYQLIFKAFSSIETNGHFNPTYSDLRTRLELLGESQGWSQLDYFRWQFSLETESMDIFRLRNVMTAESAKKITLTALALKRYQLKHGNYPSDLNLLVPEFAPTVPLDPVDGKPLRYYLKSDGTFLLYSIGDNGKDDGGNPLRAGTSYFHYWLDYKALDWVWPQPATPEEIQNYYAHPPK